MEPELELSRRDGAPDELWEIARLYWEHAGINAYGKVAWSRPAKSVPVTGWRGAVHHVAGAGAVALLPGKTCAECGGPLTLSSRTAYETGRLDVDTRCCACTPNYVENVMLTGGPPSEELRQLQQQKAVAKQAAAEAEEEARAAQQRVLDQVEKERREAIAAQYPLDLRPQLPHPESVSFRARLTALALMDYAAEGGIIEPLAHQDLVFAPSPQFASDLIHEANGKLLVIHPSTPTRAFEWTPAEAHDAPSWGGYYPLLVRMHLGLGEPDPENWADAREEVAGSLQPAAIAASEQENMLETAADLIAGEGLRYLNFKLKDEYRLPEISDDLRPRVLELLTFAAYRLSLGHLMRAIWTVTSGATNLKASKPYMPRQRITDYTVNRLEEKIQEFIAPGYQLLDPFRADTRLQLSAVTRTLYYEVMHADPLTSTLVQIRDTFPEPSDQRARDLCRAGIPDGDAARDALFASIGRWSGDTFRRALAEIESRSFEPCAPGCAHDRQPKLAQLLGASFDRLVSRIGENAASTALIETIRYLNEPLPDNDRPGDLLLTLLAQELEAL